MSAEWTTLEPDCSLSCLPSQPHRDRDQCQEGQWDLEVGFMAEIKDTFYIHSRWIQQLCEPSAARPILLRRQRRLWGAAEGSACLRTQSWRRQNWEEHPGLLLGPLLPPPAPFMLRRAEQGALVGLRFHKLLIIRLTEAHVY